MNTLNHLGSTWTTKQSELLLARCVRHEYTIFSPVKTVSVEMGK